jgi:hypothetical protein
VNYPPPFFDISYQGYSHADNLECNQQRLNGYVFDLDENYWSHEPLRVQITAQIFSMTVALSVTQGLAWQVDFPSDASPYTVQLFKTNGIPASLAYPFYRNSDCFWNALTIFFKQEY